MRVLGAILAGGQARRFGADKALAMLDGRTLLDHAAGLLAPLAENVVLCGREAGGWTCLPDRPAPGLGPLGGLAAALHHGAVHGFDRVLTVPCDTPLLPEALLREIAGAAGAAFVDGLPVCGSWPTTLAAMLDAHLARADDRSMRGWARVAGAAAVAWAGPILNVNRPGDLELAGRG